MDAVWLMWTEPTPQQEILRNHRDSQQVPKEAGRMSEQPTHRSGQRRVLHAGLRESTEWLQRASGFCSRRGAALNGHCAKAWRSERGCSSPGSCSHSAP